MALPDEIEPITFEQADKEDCWIEAIKEEIRSIKKNDLLITGSKDEEIESIKNRLKEKFEMTDLGTLSYFQVIEFLRKSRGILMHHKKYTSDVLKIFNMFDYNSSSTPVKTRNSLCKGSPNDQVVDSTLYRQMIGSLRYICNTRLDITYGVGLLSKHMEDPRQSQLMTVKRVIRYLKGIIDFGVLFPANKDIKSRIMFGYTNADCICLSLIMLLSVGVPRSKRYLPSPHVKLNILQLA
ncbi:PREDICTED: uncharacterized protein LOC109338506 [Lupinus angustifolius]|uniref:uncharacterized protein LOC109338506 n=1 Tax=Lupinus angustifolius TaxID=3871 RepID=UPI00092F08E6|nr:PREDICTED: uncharacterized protein LOC109338506 [Lupinus angustifolius]